MYEVGKKYPVDCAKVKDTLTGRYYFIPVFPLRHKDPAFGVKNEHYHLDLRFFVCNKIKETFGIKDFKTLAPVWAEHISRFRFINIRKRETLCVSTTSGMPMEQIIENANGYSSSTKASKMFIDWQKTMIGKSCAGKRCPHYGTEMIDTGDKLVCPMHNLIGCKTTEKIIAYEP